VATATRPPNRFAGKRVVVKEPVEGGRIVICHQQEQIAEHRLAVGKGAMVIEPKHGLLRRPRGRPPKAAPVRQELVASPGVGRHFQVPEVEVRPLAVYEFAEEVNHVAAV